MERTRGLRELLRELARVRCVRRPSDPPPPLYSSCLVVLGVHVERLRGVVFRQHLCMQ